MLGVWASALDTISAVEGTAKANVARCKVVDDCKMMEAIFTVEDPDAFNQPWTAMRRYRRAPLEIVETICAENNQHLFDYHIPMASKPDF